MHVPVLTATVLVRGSTHTLLHSAACLYVVVAGKGKAAHACSRLTPLSLVSVGASFPVEQKFDKRGTSHL